jgi:acyl carrier protein
VTIESQIRRFIAGELNAEVSALTDDASLIDSGVLDSLGLLEVASFLERQYRIQVADIDLIGDNFETVQTIARYVTDKAAVAMAGG